MFFSLLGKLKGASKTSWEDSPERGKKRFFGARLNVIELLHIPLQSENCMYICGDKVTSVG